MNETPSSMTGKARSDGDAGRPLVESPETRWIFDLGKAFFRLAEFSLLYAAATLGQALTQSVALLALKYGLILALVTQLFPYFFGDERRPSAVGIVLRLAGIGLALWFAMATAQAALQAAAIELDSAASVPALERYSVRQLYRERLIDEGCWDIDAAALNPKCAQLEAELDRKLERRAATSSSPPAEKKP